MEQENSNETNSIDIKLKNRLDKSDLLFALPNLLTTASLFCAFYAVIVAIDGLFAYSALAIIASALFDTLDGRVARMTNTQTKFGAEYDSLADIVSFGLAPAVVVYLWALKGINYHHIGWIVSFLYLATVGLRLARFNTSKVSDDKRYFQGLPCPAAAITLASIVWIASSYDKHIGVFGGIVVALIIIYLSVMMVSNIKFRSFKDFSLKTQKPALAAFMVIVFVAILIVGTKHILFIIFAGYALSGTILLLTNKYIKKTDNNNLTTESVSKESAFGDS